MTLRRYQPLAPSSGTRIDPRVRLAVFTRDQGCVLARITGSSDRCFGALELDHVRASGGMGMKSPSTEDNLVALCSFHHRVKTDHGREVRPILLAYLGGGVDHASHVDPCGPTCRAGVAP